MVDNGKKMMASLALFRKLYKNDNTDVLVLLGDFIKLIIERNNLRSFTVSKITDLLRVEYDFVIPESVVETSLRKFCSKTNGCYSIKNGVTLSSTDTSGIKQNNDKVIADLICYVEGKLNKKLSDEEKGELIQSFCAFIIEDVTQFKYADYISAFIIECQKDDVISEQLKTIKEGVILYTGIKYNDDVAEVGSWKNDFTIYLEQEMLFHFAGYNGGLYKRLFDDFVELVKEVNGKAKRKVIKLKYFSEVETNIDKFFYIAQRISDGKETLDPSNTAMNTIVAGCEFGADVLSEKSRFYTLLKESSIEKSDDISICDEENMQYNIYTSEKEEELKRNINDSLEDIQQSLTFVNYINIHRKNKHFSSLERSICILLTGKTTTMKVDASFRENGNVPYVTTLDFLTNRIWCKLNKGFGDNKYPKSFDIVTKAQIVLSSYVSGSVSNEFEDFKMGLSKGTISKEEAARTLVALKSYMLKPEDINIENIGRTLLTISDIEIAKRELDNQRNEYNEKLKIAEKEKRLLEQDKNELKAKLLLEKQKRLKMEEDKKNKADKAYKKYDRLIRISYYLVHLVLVGLIVWLIYHYSLDRYTLIFTFLPAVVTSICNICIGHSVKHQVILSKISTRLKCLICKKYDVDEGKIEELRKSIELK